MGWLADGSPDTPLLPAALEDTGSELRLTILWSTQAGTDFVYRWFAGRRVYWSDDPDYSRQQYAPPPLMWFQTEDGIATLVHCHAASSSTNLRLGQGVSQVDFAVLNTGSTDYSAVHGLRSEVVGLLDWLELRTAAESRTVDDHGRVQGYTVAMEAQPPIALARALNLVLRPGFSTSRSDTGDLVLRESALIETVVSRPRAWADHLVMHGAVRDLVSIASWHPCGYAGHWALRRDDPHGAMDGRQFGERWAEVRTHVTTAGSSLDVPTRFLFRYSDTRQRPIGAWQRLRAHFSRGVNPLLATLDDRNGGLEAALALSCIGLDGIGFQLALDDGASPSGANGESHRQRFERVASRVGPLVPFEIAEWSQRAADASNGIKHANRDMPDLLTMANTLRENCLLFRLWVARSLGVSPMTLRRNLPTIPQASPYTLR